MNGLKTIKYKKDIVAVTLGIILLLILNNIIAYYLNYTLKLGQIGIVIVKLSTYIFVYVLIINLFNIKPKEYIKSKIGLRAASMILVGIILNLLFNVLLGSILGSGISKELSLYEYINRLVGVHILLKSPYGLVYLGILTVLVAPVFEELVFRGYIANKIYLNTGSKVGAIITSSLLFGIMHLSISTGINAFLYGIVASYIYFRCKNIKVTIAMHSLINLLTLMLIVIK